MPNDKDNWMVTRWCCTSGMCTYCRAVRTGQYGPTIKPGRIRTVHAYNLSEAMAQRMVKNWAAYDARAVQPDHPTVGA